MRKVNIIGIFIITTLWAGCKMRDDKMRSDVPVLKPVEQSVDKIKTQFRTVATPIPLETNKECVVGYITNIHATKDRIYIMDRDNFYLFDSDGKFLKILPKGKGPGEITRPMTFKVNKDKDEIIILDNGIWINLFTLDGTFKKRYQLKMSIRDVIRIV